MLLENRHGAHKLKVNYQKVQFWNMTMWNRTKIIQSFYKKGKKEEGGTEKAQTNRERDKFGWDKNKKNCAGSIVKWRIFELELL